MSERECVDRRMGVMLHAYEVGALAEGDNERFEIHLLRCRGCFEAVQSFASSADLLRNDAGVREVVREATGETAARSGDRGWVQWLWPARPWPLRPAVPYLLLLILLYPAYRGLQPSSPRPVIPLQAITLIPSRSAEVEGIRLQSGRDAAITFVFRGATPGKPYRVRLTAADGQTVYADEAFTAFDRYETGQILFPAERMHAGGYLLEVIDPAGSSPQNRQAYRFEVRP